MAREGAEKRLGEANVKKEKRPAMIIAKIEPKSQGIGA